MLLPGDGTYVVRDEVRALVTFVHNNLIADAPPFKAASIDLIVCRHVTIYFARETTRALVGRFQAALAPEGWLLMGPAESLWQVSDAFTLEAVGEAFAYRSAADRPVERPGPRPVDRATPAGLSSDRPADRPGPSARFEATVFEVVMAPESGIGLDAKKLAADGPTPAKLVAALAPLGNARLLYRIDQVVPIDGHATHIEVSRDVPYVTGPQIGPPGTPQPPGISIGRTKGGVRFELNAFCPDQADPRFQATIDVKLATMNASATKLGGDVTAPEFSDITQKYGGVAELGRPIVLLTVDGTTTGGAEESRAYVTLITLSAAGK